MIAVEKIIPFLDISIATGCAFAALLVPQEKRADLTVPVVFFAYRAFAAITDVTIQDHYASVLGLYVLLWLAHLFNVLFIENIVIPNGSTRERCLAAYKWLTNGRWIGTTRAAPGIGPSQPPNKNPILSNVLDRFIASLFRPVFNIDNEASFHKRIRRINFCIRRVTLCIVLFTLNHLYEQHVVLGSYPDLFDPLTIDDFTPTRNTYLRRLFMPGVHDAITSRENAIRAMLILHFIWTEYVTFTFLHAACSVVFVGVLRFDEPEEWPALFGSLSCTSTIRGFWGGFWHRLVYRTYTSFGRVLSTAVGVTPRSTAGRVFIAGFVFCFSGIMHVIVEWNIGMCGYMSSLTWFALNFGALVIEDGVLKFSRKVLGVRMCSWSGWKIFGYAWVWGFMFWSLPKGQYNKMWCSAATV